MLASQRNAYQLHRMSTHSDRAWAPVARCEIKRASTISQQLLPKKRTNRGSNDQAEVVACVGVWDKQRQTEHGDARRTRRA